MSIQDTKSLLAKLLAEENLTVQHRKTQTAYFDTKQRILVCPILKDMPVELYDLLMGHEVGHALFTPPEGWHNALTENMRPGFKSFLNIVEDARIERFVKNKFPGIRSSFYRGYKNLSDRDFFGINGYDVNSLKLIDKINLHFKLGTLVSIAFSEEELDYVDMVEQTKTWDDVVRVANALYEYAKSEESQTDTHQDSAESGEDGEESESFDLDDFDGEFDQVGEGSDSEEGIEDDYFKPNPESLTDRAFRSRERELVDESCIPIAYVNLPRIKISERIIPHKVVYENMVKTLPESDMGGFEGLANFFDCSIKKFNDKNGRYVNYLVKEFELRKNAKQFARASINKTGELDMQKVGKYRLTEDLFRRVTIVPQGKNHGLLLFLDLSGSMQDNIPGTIEQLLILTMFCRKVNIPFAVYGFTDSCFDDKAGKYDSCGGFQDSPIADIKVNDLYLNNFSFRLKEYLTSSMSRIEYNNAVSKLLVIMSAYQRRYVGILPFSEKLNGTPMDEAIIASIDIANNFRKAYKLEMLTTMFLTDGEATRSPSRYITEINVKDSSYYNVSTYHFRGQVSGSYNYMLTLNDPKSRQSITANLDDCNMTSMLLRLAKKITGANYIGFFIGQEGDPLGRSVRKVMNIYGIKSETHEADLAKARKNKFFPLMGTGFDVYYVIPGGNDLKVKDSQMVVSDDASKNELKKAFQQTMSSRAVNRVFLSRFCNTLCEQL